MDTKIIQAMCALKARNCEIHLARTNGPAPQVNGIFMPTLMLETA